MDDMDQINQYVNYHLSARDCPRSHRRHEHSDPV
jgi:hypothetical protein